MKVIAKYAFTGNPREGQLTFPEGAQIDCNSDGHHPPRNGWVYGIYNRQKGWFPEAFVQPILGEGHQHLPPPSMASAPPAPPPPVAYAHAYPVQPSAPPLVMGQAMASPPSQPKQLNPTQISKLLEQGYTRGLAMSINKNAQSFAKRIWIVDNSGSMAKTDGHRIVETSQRNDLKFVACSRWEEIQECVRYHIQLAALLQLPTSFRFLNDPGAHVGPQEFVIDTATSDSNETSQYIVREALQTVNKARPGGCTPLTDHILAIHAEVEAMAPKLRAHGQRVAIIIATDGLPTNERGYGGEQHQQQFVDALRLLEGFPVWVVVRLCTDEEAVVNFYNDLDKIMELSVEVLDDFCGEAEEVHEENPWLTYGLSLHRLREMGYHERVFDLLDERPLTKGELRDFCSLLMGENNMDGVPDPAADWPGFVKQLDRWLKNKDEPIMQWDPIKKKQQPWLHISKLNHKYGDGACIIS